MANSSFVIKRICIVQYGVKDMESMVNWFTEVLSFQHCPVSDDAHGSIVSLVQDGCRLLFHSGPKPLGLDYLGESNTLVVFEVEDLDKAVELLKKHKVEFATQKPQNFHLGRFIAFRDPFGNERELVEFRQ